MYKDISVWLWSGCVKLGTLDTQEYISCSVKPVTLGTIPKWKACGIYVSEFMIPMTSQNQEFCFPVSFPGSIWCVLLHDSTRFGCSRGGCYLCGEARRKLGTQKCFWVLTLQIYLCNFGSYCMLLWTGDSHFFLTIESQWNFEAL